MALVLERGGGGEPRQVLGLNPVPAIAKHFDSYSV